MDTTLIYVIVLLSLAICALGGFWFYRAAQANKTITHRTQQAARGMPSRDPWMHAARPARDKR